MPRGSAYGEQRCYAASMKTLWQGRVTQATVNYSEQAQMATVCCNVCRTCVQANLIGLGVAALAASGAWFSRLGRRITKPS